MAKITPPNWAKDAGLSTRGWTKNGELLKVQRFSQVQVDSYNNKTIPATTKKVVMASEIIAEPVAEIIEEIEEPKMEMLNEAPANHKSLDDMTKRELKAEAVQRGVEFSTKDTKKVLLEKLN